MPHHDEESKQGPMGVESRPAEPPRYHGNEQRLYEQSLQEIHREHAFSFITTEYGGRATEEMSREGVLLALDNTEWNGSKRSCKSCCGRWGWKCCRGILSAPLLPPPHDESEATPYSPLAAPRSSRLNKFTSNAGGSHRNLFMVVTGWSFIGALLYLLGFLLDEFGLLLVGLIVMFLPFVVLVGVFPMFGLLESAAPQHPGSHCSLRPGFLLGKYANDVVSLVSIRSLFPCGLWKRDLDSGSEEVAAPTSPHARKSAWSRALKIRSYEMYSGNHKIRASCYLFWGWLFLLGFPAAYIYATATMADDVQEFIFLYVIAFIGLVATTWFVISFAFSISVFCVCRCCSRKPLNRTRVDFGWAWPQCGYNCPCFGSRHRRCVWQVKLPSAFLRQFVLLEGLFLLAIALIVAALVLGSFEVSSNAKYIPSATQAAFRMPASFVKNSPYFNSGVFAVECDDDSDQCDVYKPPSSSSSRMLAYTPSQVTHPFPLCGYSWEEFSLRDLSFMAYIAYDIPPVPITPSEANAAEQLISRNLNDFFSKQTGKPTSWNVQIPPGSTTLFADLNPDGTDTHIIAIEGTTNANLDGLLHDLGIWSETAVYQTVAAFAGVLPPIDRSQQAAREIVDALAFLSSPAQTIGTNSRLDFLQ